MAPTVGTQCAAGTALSATSLTVTLNQDIPQSSPTDGVSIFIIVTYWSLIGTAGFAIPIITDNGTAPSSGYGPFATNSENAPGVNMPGVFDPVNGNFSPFCTGYSILRPLSAGDELTFNFTGGNGIVDYFRVSCFPVHQILNGEAEPFQCTPDGTGAGGGSDLAWTGNGVDFDQFYTPGGTDTIAFSMLAVGEQPGITGMTFNDTDLIVLDSWIEDGPGDVSALVGYRTIPSDGFYDSGGQITGVLIPPVGPGYGFVGGNAYVGGTGVPYCTPGASYPVFNNRFRAAA